VARDRRVGLHGRGGTGRRGGRDGGADAVEDVERRGAPGRRVGGGRDGTRGGLGRLLGRGAGGDEDAESQKEHDAPLQTLPDQRGHEALDGLHEALDGLKGRRHTCLQLTVGKRVLCVLVIKMHVRETGFFGPLTRT
jgi:hypothetical protein